MKIIVASNNKHKIEEIKAMLDGLKLNGQKLEGQKLEVRSLKEEGIEIDPEETGKTFEENAYIKAKAVYDYMKAKEKQDPAKADSRNYRNNLVLADDSGLAVDHLEGAPGVFSARWAGTPCNDQANNEKLLKEMAGVPMEKRQAKFVCAMVLIGHKIDIRVHGEAPGYLIEVEKGFHGFGYDPIFFSSDLAKTFAEASAIEKNHVSHRAKALKELKKELAKL
ncbi:MAG: RdgB/HAM1 family non-canonical purine NTP pyrophosphatase [Clostridiaceae bacterium]